MPAKKTPKKKAPAKPKSPAKRQRASGTINKNAKKQLDQLKKQGF